MPIYEYRCSSCGHEVEVLQKLSEARLVVCPACSETALVKLMSAAGFQLKGTGWYATDFKGSGAKPAPKSEDAAAKGTEESKSDNTADAKDKKSDAKVAATAESNAGKSDSKTETKAPASTAPSTAGS
jgi:putative FmdB family regulatory protein